MITYEPLTKKITDEDGNKMIVCRFYGTEECQIHKPNGCNNCRMFSAILAQLYEFEETYMEEDNES